MTNEIIRTGVYTRSGNERFDLDDPKQRLRLTKYTRDLLAPILEWFNEGFHLPDLVEAKALL
jgi:hypothetical protein